MRIPAPARFRAGREGCPENWKKFGGWGVCDGLGHPEKGAVQCPVPGHHPCDHALHLPGQNQGPESEGKAVAATPGHQGAPGPCPTCHRPTIQPAGAFCQLGSFINHTCFFLPPAPTSKCPEWGGVREWGSLGQLPQRDLICPSRLLFFPTVVPLLRTKPSSPLPSKKPKPKSKKNPKKD